MEEKGVKAFKSFTTEPKFRRFQKRGAFISLNRALEFMAHLWEVGLKKCSYETLEFEFIQYFGSNDKRTIERYLGRPEKIERHLGISKVVRMNRQSGKVAQFEYMNERKLPAKKGLLEILGYISKVKEGNECRYIIHHERMPYYTVQTTLTEPEKETRESGNVLQEFEGSSEASKEGLRVCSLYVQAHSLIERENMRGENIEGEEKRREEVIDNTHTNQTSCSSSKPQQPKPQGACGEDSGGKEKANPRWKKEAEGAV